MQPWMILALLLGAGVVVLLIAPTIHRRSVEKSRAGLTASREERVAQLRASDAGIEFPLGARDALRIRDALLLRGVRTEVVNDGSQAMLVGTVDDRSAIQAAIDELAER